jgi:hypothetical protein
MNKLPCPGPLTRRDFLRAGALALGGLTLPRLLAARDGTPPDTSVILFWMWGGPSHLETYDLKPDAPSEYRGHPTWTRRCRPSSRTSTTAAWTTGC